MSIDFTQSPGFEINDSEILKLERGPVAWARNREGTSQSIDQFVRDLQEQVNHCGLSCEVKVFDTNVSGVYAFEVELNGRVGGSVFDPDRQVHEVTTNLLSLPGEHEGFIPSKEGMAKLFAREQAKARDKAKHNQHKH